MWLIISLFSNTYLCSIISVFDYSKVFMILCVNSNYYDLELIFTKCFWAELIILAVVNMVRWTKCMVRLAGMCWGLLLVLLQWILHGGSARHGWFGWRLEHHNGMVCCGRDYNYDSTYGADRIPSGKGWVAVETQKTDD